MKIKCPRCGFSGTFGATMPTDAQRAAGIKSQAVDLLDTSRYVENETGELAICSHCGAPLVFAGWVEIVPDLLMNLSPEARKIIREGQEAVRRMKQDRRQKP